MTTRRLGLWPAVLLAMTTALLGAMVPLSVGLEPVYDTVGYGVAALALGVAGALIASQQPSNPIGWLFCAMGVYGALVEVIEGYSEQAAAHGWLWGSFAAWIGTWAWVGAGSMWMVVFFPFPAGRLPVRGWRVVAVAALVGCVIQLVGQLLNPHPDYEFVTGSNPLAVDGEVIAALRAVGMVMFTLGIAASMASLFARFRRATGVERQQLKAFVYVVCVAAVVMPVTDFVFYDSLLVRVLIAAVLVALPVAACVAILRYRLYDVDLIITRTLVYGVLTVLLTAAYAITTLVLGTALGRHSAWATAGATLAVAVTFRPLRGRVQDFVDRRFSRARYDALRRIEAFLDALRAGGVVPEGVEALLRDVLDDQRLELRLLLPDGARYVDIEGHVPAEVLDDPRDQTPVHRAGRPIAMVLHRPEPRGGPLLLTELVAAAGLAIEMTLLRVELRRRLEEVEASRARIVSAGYEERRRIERDLHDGAQQRLISIGLALRNAQHELDGSHSVGARDTLEGAVGEVTMAIAELRELARGVRPAQLDGGLQPALRELAGRVPVAVEVHASSERYPGTVEAAAYFIACEALTNAVKHATASLVVMSVARQNGSLIVSVSDDGVGGATAADGSGLGGLADRVHAHGGSLRVESPAGSGTTLVAELPCES